MKLLEKKPMLMIMLGIFGISLSSIFVRYSDAPSAVTAAWRLLWTVVLMTPAVFGKASVRRELFTMGRKLLVLSILSGLFLAAHFATWFESLQHTSVASSTTIVSTEVIWVSLGWWLVLKGKLSGKAVAAIAVTLGGSMLIAWSDSGSGAHLYGDILALLSAVAVGAYTLIGRIVRSRASTTTYTYLVYTTCAAVLLVTCAVQGMGLLDYGPEAVVVGLLLSLFSTILGHSIFSWCLKYFSPSFVSASKLCEPVVAAGFAAFLFGEIPTAFQALGSVLILGGVLWYSKIENQKSTS
jgi:drug/metabolite transporter (DMT)-like permease